MSIDIWVSYNLKYYRILQYSHSQRGSADSDSKVWTLHRIIVFYSIPAPREGLQIVIVVCSIPAPREGLQIVIPKFGLSTGPLYFTVFQLADRVCR